MTVDVGAGVLVQGCGGGIAEERAGLRTLDRKGFAIDMHCHLLNAEVEGLVAATTEKQAEPEMQILNGGAASHAHNQSLFATTYHRKLTDLSVRLADMDAMGVDVQVISPTPTQYYYWAKPDLSEEIVRKTNLKIAEIVAAYPDRFAGLGLVSLQEPRLAVDQADHAVRRLGLKGVEISTLVNGVDVSDRRFDPFWAKMEALDAVVFMHPLGTTIGPRLNQHYLSNIVGQPAETAIALSKMIFDGLFDRHERLKLCAAHGGGYLPLSISRSDHGYAVRPEACGCQHKPSEYLRRIWFDTVIYDSDHLRRLIDQVGVGQVVVGTDYPFDMGDYAPHDLIDGVPGLSEADKGRILGENAAKLLGLAPRTARSADDAGDRAFSKQT